MIREGVIMITSDGVREGQVNGLSVYDLGDYRFGRPTKITAAVATGRAGIINIERESDLSGRSHNKGMLILAGYLRSRFAKRRPMTLSASLAFEQSYSGVDGDSASSTELYALVSALSGLPLRQDIAVTGSVNQKGEVQAIGGVNEKIEGFFDTCKSLGLTGDQGVMIPQAKRFGPHASKERRRSGGGRKVSHLSRFDGRARCRNFDAHGGGCRRRRRQLPRSQCLR